MSLKAKSMVKPNVWALEVSIDAETFEAAIQRAFNKKRKSITLPGFRKGKATRKMIENFYGEGFFYEDALDECYGPAVEAAIKESELDYFATDGVDVKSVGAEGVELVVNVAVVPKAEIADYKGFAAAVKPTDVTAEEVDAKIQSLRESRARVQTVEGRPAQNGDIAVIDYDGSVDGVPFDGGKAESYELTLGSGNFIPGFEEKVVGHSAGEEFDIDVTFPENYHEELAGKAAVFKIKLSEIKEKQIPELDDDFAQESADCDTVDDLRKSVESEIAHAKEHENEHLLDRQLNDKIVEATTVDIPEIMVEKEIDSEVNEANYRLSSQGLSLELYLQYMSMTMEKYREQMAESCERRVKLRLALKAIAEAEGLEVTPEEIEKKYAEYAENYSMEIEKIKQLAHEEDIKTDLMLEKAMQTVRDSASITVSEDAGEEHGDDCECEDCTSDDE